MGHSSSQVQSASSLSLPGIDLGQCLQRTGWPAAQPLIRRSLETRSEHKGGQMEPAPSQSLLKQSWQRRLFIHVVQSKQGRATVGALFDPTPTRPAVVPSLWCINILFPETQPLFFLSFLLNRSRTRSFLPCLVAGRLAAQWCNDKSS